jgi:phage terminase large subunit-like protein
MTEPAHFCLNYRQTMQFYAKALAQAAGAGASETDKVMRDLGSTDLFFLLVFILKRSDMIHPWLFARCREVQREPNGHLDLWAREHGKSSVITFGLTIFDIINDPDITIGIFSHTKPVAKKFLSQIKAEMETNADLPRLWPGVFWANPKGEAQKWSEDGGLIVKRASNPKEATIEAHGLVDGQPTGRHFKLRIYDDVVTMESVSTPEQIAKTTSAWQMSNNLGAIGGNVRYIGTRYHMFDTYRSMLDAKSAIPRIHPATDDGTELGKPVFMSQEILADKRRDQGPYIYCFPAEAPILMADWTEKPIAEIKTGDVVVGYDFPKAKKTKLVRSIVKSVSSRTEDVYEYAFESGRTVRCTESHRWYTGRRGKEVGGTDNHSAYAPLGFHKSELKSLISVYDRRILDEKYDIRAAAWLGGIFDGEGAVSGGCIHIHQSESHNPVVCRSIENAMRSLGFDFGVTNTHSHSRDNKKYGHGRDYYIRGGRQEKIRFLNICKPVRGQKIIDFLFDQGTREFGKSCRDRLVSVNKIGFQRVYNIETETGNYIAYGYATKNCAQMLLNPTADKAMGFRREWLVHTDVERLAAIKQLWRFIIVDPAGSKQRQGNDYTTMFVIGHGEDCKFRVLDIVRDRLNLIQRGETLMDLHRIWTPGLVAYEEYGMQADIEHIRYVQKQEMYEFDIVPLGGSMPKPLRILRLVPYFESGRIILPTRLNRVDYQGHNRDLIADFVEQEYTAFPVLKHDDMLDTLARIPDLEAMSAIEKPKKTLPTERGNTGFRDLQNNTGRNDDWLTA